MLFIYFFSWTNMGRYREHLTFWLMIYIPKLIELCPYWLCSIKLKLYIYNVYCLELFTFLSLVTPLMSCSFIWLFQYSGSLWFVLGSSGYEILLLIHLFLQKRKSEKKLKFSKQTKPRILASGFFFFFFWLKVGGTYA